MAMIPIPVKNGIVTPLPRMRRRRASGRCRLSEPRHSCDREGLTVRGLPSMTSALEGGEGGSQKVDKSTDKLRDHVCDKGGRGSKNSKFSWTSLMEAP